MGRVSMKKFVLALSVVLTIGFAAAVVAEAGLLNKPGSAPSHGLPYGAYRVSPLTTVVDPPPPPPDRGGVDIGGGNTPILLRGGTIDNTNTGTNPDLPKTETK
jgi:hypothetical protein